VFVLIPLALKQRWVPVPPIPLLILFALDGFLLVRGDAGFPAAALTGWPAEGMRPVLLRTAILCGVIGLGVWCFAPARLFDFVRTNPLLWSAVMILYPLLSVYPQEFLYRAFFFHRYRPLFQDEMSMILASALAFGFVHIIFGNWLSVGLTAIGGVLFGITYVHTGSLLAASVEHALFGNFLFTIGLGEFFYHGSRMARG
jgi:hypothetical protein